MKPYFAFCLALLLSVNCIAQKNNSTTAEQLRGLWMLDKYESYDTLTHKWSTEHGRMGYTGYTLFDGAGHMSTQITPADYNEFNLSKKADSLGMKIILEYYNNNLVYFADYKIEKNSLEQKIISSTNPESVGAVLKRDFEIKGKTLFLMPANKLLAFRIRTKWVKVQ